MSVVWVFYIAFLPTWINDVQFNSKFWSNRGNAPRELEQFHQLLSLLLPCLTDSTVVSLLVSRPVGFCYCFHKWRRSASSVRVPYVRKYILRSAPDKQTQTKRFLAFCDDPAHFCHLSQQASQPASQPASPALVLCSSHLTTELGSQPPSPWKAALSFSFPRGVVFIQCLLMPCSTVPRPRRGPPPPHPPALHYSPPKPMGRLHLTKSETRFNTDRTITYCFVVRPVETIVII
jgi:hypothetical protein